MHQRRTLKLQNSWSLNARATLVATQMKLITSLQLVIMATIDYHQIYFAYIRSYRVQVATNVQLNYNSKIF
jgi:hypothetical protein